VITIGQNWVSPSGVTYTVEAKIPGGYEVSVRAENGPVTASDGRWNFTPTKLRNLIKAEKLKLYDASAALDRIADRLEQKKLMVIASELDAISTEYVEARQPSKLRHDRRRQAKEQLEALQEQLEAAEDPENQERIVEQIEEAMKEFESVRDNISDVNDVSVVTPVSDSDPVSRIGTVSKP
jgi:hypothetical protein